MKARASICAVLIALAGGAGAMTLFEDGATTARIVRAASVEPCVTNAVTELARALNLISGATFAIVDDGAPQAGDVFVGVDANLPAPGDERVAYRLTDGILYLVGNEPRAALHAVYSFLQRELGVRWLWPGDDGEFMPARASYTVPADLDWSHVPSIKYRGFHCCGDWYDRANFLVWMSRNCATVHRHGFPASERKFGFYNMYSCHNADLSGDTALFEAHPEYYAEVNGTRIKANICFSSDGAVDAVITQIVKTVESYAQRGAPLEVLSIFPGDNQDYCECALCSQMSVSTGWFSFYDKIVAKMRPLYPSMKFATIAYQGYRDTPDCAVPDTEFVEYATHARCHVHKYGDADCPNNATDSARLAAWDDFDVPVGLYNYEYDVFSTHDVYAPFFCIIDDIVSEAARRGHVVVIPEVGMSPRYGPAVEVNSIRNRLSQYLYVRKMWDASLTEDDWMSDVTATAYGPAAAAMTGYFKTMEAAWTNSNRHIAILANAANYVTSILTSNAQETAEAYLAQAEAIAAASDHADAARFQADVARERILFSQWVTLRDEAAGNAVILRAPRLSDTNEIPDGVATDYALADTNGTASSVSVRAAWAGAEPGRSGNPRHLLVEFTGVPAAAAALDAAYAVTLVSPGTDGSYAFTVAKDGTASAVHTSGTGVDSAFSEEWSVTREGTTLRLTIPVFAFDEPPIAGSTWYARFERTASADDAVAFPHVAGGSVPCVFMNRDATDRPLLYYYGRDGSLGNADTLRMQAAESGFTMTIATNMTELSARDAATKTFWLRIPPTNEAFPDDFRRDLTNAVAQGGVALMTSYWTMPIATLFGDPTLACSVGSPDSSSISTRRATYVSDDRAFCAPNDLATKQSYAITPAYSILPSDESRWTVLCRVKGKGDGSYGGKDHPYLMYRRYGKGFLVVGSETIATDFHSLLENFLARVEELLPDEIHPGDDVETRVSEKRAEWVADGEAKTLNVFPSVYTLSRELYVDFPLTLAGATGDPADATIQGDKTFRILTINHADAEVKDLTIAKGRFNNEGGLYNWGNAGVRICKPTNLDRTDKNWHACTTGAGGKLTHCIVTDCSTTYWHCWGVVYLNGPKAKTIVDRCTITNNTHSGQNNARKSTGDIVTVQSGVFMNSLVAQNTSSNKDVSDTDRSTYQGMVAVTGANGEIVGCTIARNAVNGGDSRMRVSGVLARAGKVVNTVIAGNTSQNPLEAKHKAWAGTASCFVNCLTDNSEPINDTCRADFDVGLADLAGGDYHPMHDSPAVAAGSTTAASAYGTLDYYGNARLTDETLDVGAAQRAEVSETTARVVSSVTACNEPVTVRFVAYSAGLGEPLAYRWDLDGDGTDDVVTTTNAVDHLYTSVAQYAVRCTVTNTASGASKAVTLATPLDVRIGSHIYHIYAEDGADAFQKKLDWLVAQPGATVLRQEFVLHPGIHQITNEVMMTWPLVVHGSTGCPGDVVVDVQNRNKAFCLNHADARLESLTVYRAFCDGVNSYGVVRLCSPNGRGNQTNSTKGWGAGGVVSNVVLNACSSSGKFDGQLFLLNASGVITHCMVTNCSIYGQTDGAVAGYFLNVAGGRADNILIAKNSIGMNDCGSYTDGCCPAVNVSGGSLVNATVTRNSGVTKVVCAGIQATGGSVVNAIVAGNTAASTRAHYSTWVGTGSCFVRCFLDCADADVPNATCLNGTDAKFLRPARNDFRPVKESPCVNVGTNDAKWVYGETDLEGRPRTRVVEDETKIDLGAYQYDPDAHYAEATCVLPSALYDRVTVSASVAQGGFGVSPVYYWDFDGDGVTDLVTTESAVSRDFGLGDWSVSVAVSNVTDGIGQTVAASDGTFSVTPHPVHYVDVNGTNPVSPYLTPETAATNIQDAIDVAATWHEVKILPGVYPISWSLSLTTDGVTVGGATGRPEDVEIRATSGRNRCLQVNAGPNALVHSLTFSNGRGGTGAARTSNFAGFKVGSLSLANVYQDANGNEGYGGTHLGGTVSNCIVRGGSADNKFGTTAGVLVRGSNSRLTHCVISNCLSSAGYSDNGNFAGTALVLMEGGRAEHCLVTKNATRAGNGYYQAAVFVADGGLLRYSTVTENSESLVGGVNVAGSGRFEKCVIAGNRLDRTADTTNPRHAVWGAFDFGVNDLFFRQNGAAYLAAEDARHTNDVVQARVTTNGTNLAESHLGPGTKTAELRLLFQNPAKGDYRPRRASPTVDAVPRAAESEPMPARDLRGAPRHAGGGYDLGALERPLAGAVLRVR